MSKNTESESQEGEAESNKGTKSVLKYAGLATTMFFSMLIAWYGGSYLDGYFNNEIEYIGLSFVILTLFAYFYKLIKDLA